MLKKTAVIPAEAGILYKFFSHNLIRWYTRHKRDLPWRRTKDPYKIWVSEIMLAQTTVQAVIVYYERWIKAFPTVHGLARAPLQKVLKQWQGLGYYDRARNLHKAAKMLVKEHQGLLPPDPLIVQGLPGFGPYTTGAVLSIAYDIPLPIIDTNIRRVVMRLLALQGVANAQQDARVREFLLKVYPSQRAGDFNQALMELGALICRNKQPQCSMCPVSGCCQAYQQGRQEIIPRPHKKIIKNIQAVIAIIQKDGYYFIQKRPPFGLLAGLWEFPGGKIEYGESPKKALRRELKEELSLQLKSARYLFEVKHCYTQFKVNLSVFACSVRNQPKVDANHRWINYKDFSKYPLPSASSKIIEKLQFSLSSCFNQL